MEYKMKCNVCGKVFCYTDDDLKKNASNAAMGALSAIGGLASALGGGTIFHTHHLQGQSDRYSDKVVDYSQCPNCHSRDISAYHGDENNSNQGEVFTTVKNINTSASTEALLKRVFIFLEDGDWASADAYCEACLDRDPELAMAYLGKLMADLHIRTLVDLKNQEKPFEHNANYLKIVRYGDAELKKTLLDCIEQINTRNENTRKDQILSDAKNKMIQKNISNYEKARTLLETIRGWKDADEQINICLSRIAELKAKEEIDRLERKRLAEAEAEATRKKAQKRKTIAKIIAPILAVLIVAAVLISNIVKKNQEEAARLEAYNVAIAMAEAGLYDEAIDAFVALGEYKDSSQQLIQVVAARDEEAYEKAMTHLEAGEYDAAIEIFEELGDYKDSLQQLTQAKDEEAYEKAMAYLEAGEYDAAIEIFEKLGDYKDSRIQCEKAENTKYEAEKERDWVMDDLVRNGEVTDKAYIRCAVDLEDGGSAWVGLVPYVAFGEAYFSFVIPDFDYSGVDNAVLRATIEGSIFEEDLEPSVKNSELMLINSVNGLYDRLHRTLALGLENVSCVLVVNDVEYKFTIPCGTYADSINTLMAEYGYTGYDVKYYLH